MILQVANHNRKMRKLAKKNKGNKVHKKDPGIPGSAPFKEEVLREAEIKKEQVSSSNDIALKHLINDESILNSTINRVSIQTEQISLKSL